LGNPYPDVVAVQPSDKELRALEGAYQRDQTTIETLSVRDDTLYAQRGTGHLIPLQLTAEGQLHLIPDELSFFLPVRDAAGRITRLDYFEGGDGPPRPMPRVPQRSH